MSLVATSTVLPAVMRRGVRCGKCDRMVSRIGSDMATLRIIFSCHGAVEFADIPIGARDASWVPAVVFLPRWPGFSAYRTTTKPERRVVP